MTKNPYLENIRREAYHVKETWRGRKEDIEDNDDINLSGEDVERVAEEMYDRFKDSCYFADDCTDTLPSLLSKISDMAGEWKAMQFGLERQGEDRIRRDFYSEMSMAAYEEVERIQFVMENYL